MQISTNENDCISFQIYFYSDYSITLKHTDRTHTQFGAILMTKPHGQFPFNISEIRLNKSYVITGRLSLYEIYLLKSQCITDWIKLSFQITLWNWPWRKNLIPEGEMATHIFRMFLFLGVLGFKFSPLCIATYLCEVTSNNSSQVPFSLMWTGLSWYIAIVWNFP